MTEPEIRLQRAAGETNTAAVVRELSAQIVSGKLPPGKKLDETLIGEYFGVSRTPVREALRELAVIGLVETRPHRGAFVAEVSPDKMLEKFEFMAELEGLCAGYAARRMSPEAKAKLEEIHEDGLCLVEQRDRAAYRDHNFRFHEAIYYGAGNDSLRDATLSIRRAVAAFRAAQFDLKERIGNSQVEHGLIVAAIRRGTAEEATLLMRRHILTVMEAARTYLRDKRVIPF
ncbi:putative D-xylose utilization operon transcriptional repressor [Antarctobacter heliothermus]|uniref:Putative D-xylose utilization operon transcriptional repressor n=1 Tax=Antarctobacter heliothermus TaxID=74033 RepID=A0A222E2I7_9RHOB|nr:GntR family transcriptional regulator [Antarctobacter heliothermus]ASP20439.1 putative D-xylose utilization operon transcriptional repressor [Antarctobacter heliothermus]